MKTARRVLAGLLVTMAVLYGGAVGYLYLFQRDYVFHPGGALALPAEKGLPEAEVVSLKSDDGGTLTGWHAPARPGNPTVLYFHGNSGNMSERSSRFRQILDSGFGLLAVSYRGYPGSSGAPSEAGIFADALTSFDWLAERTPDIVLHGESLGTGVATYVASQRDARALILEAPYTATVDIAAAAYPWVPVGYLMTDQFRSRDHIRDVREPVLIVHGTADTVIPVEYGKRLFAAAGEPKELAIIEGARHDNLWDRGLWPLVLQFLQKNGVSRSGGG
jgi:fermentation-respiration switch protein FrsA (DUF1100 family)